MEVKRKKKSVVYLAESGAGEAERLKKKMERYEVKIQNK